jgi:peroxiredoxin
MKTLFLISAFMMGFVTSASAQAVVGQPAPDFSLSPLGGGAAVSLTGLSGKVVYVFLYGAGCPHCRANGPVTESQIHQAYDSNDSFQAIGIDTWNDPTSTNNTFRSVTGITYPLLLNGRNVLNAYYGNFSSYDRSVVIGSDGKLLYRGTGFVNTDVAAVKAVIEAELARIVSIDEDDLDRPNETRLLAPYPNPFNPSTMIGYEVGAHHDAPVHLAIYDILGREIAVLVDDVMPAGSHSVRFSGDGLTSGMYFVRLQTADQLLVRSITLLK